MTRSPTTIAAIRASLLDVPLSEPFSIATAVRTRAENVLVSARLADGTIGHGECAPMDAESKETQRAALEGARAAADFLVGQDAARFQTIADLLEERYPNRGSVRAGVEMAVLDAWARRRRIPLWTYFGGAGSSVRTDVTVTIVPPDQAARAARRILRRGISVLKIKIGKDIDSDVARVLAVAATAPRARLIVDANQGYDPSTALRFLKKLRDHEIRPVLFEQPVPRADLDGMARVSRLGGVPVAADESASGRSAVLRLIQKRAADVINLKLMKCGIRETLDMARIAQAAGVGLMMGGMVESRLAMTCAAHLAAGIGGFQFIDLDTPLWFARDPMRGVPLRHGGLYDLSKVRAGIGVRPRESVRGDFSIMNRL